MGALTPRTSRAAMSVATAAGLVAAITLTARVAGFGRTLVFAEAVRSAGVGAIYNTVNAVPNVLYEIAAGGVLAAVVVPIVGRHLGSGDPQRAHRSVSALLTWAVAVLVPIAVLLAIAAPLLSAWLVDPRQPGAVEVGTTMLRIFAVQVPLYGMGIVLAGLLQAHRRFVAAALAPLQSSVVVIVAYAAYGAMTAGSTDPANVSHAAVLVLAWGTTLGVAALSLPLVLPALSTGWRWQPTFAFPAGDARRVAQLAGAGMLALSAQQVLVVVTIWLANHRGDTGTMSVYQYIQAVYVLPYAVLAVPIATAVTPTMAHAEGAGRDLADTLARAVRAILVVTGLAAAVLIATAGPVQTFFAVLDAHRGDGNVSTDSLHELASGLVAYAPGLIGFGLIALASRVLYVRGSARRAGAIIAAGWLMAAVIPLTTLADSGGAGRTLRMLGIGSSVGMTVAAVGLLALVVRSWGRAAIAGAGRTASGTVAGLVVGGVAGWSIGHTWPPSGLGSSLVIAAIAAAVAVAAYTLIAGVIDRRAVMEAIRRGRQGERP
ncbi:MAG: murein biosynthesis integral membrane protein MurJ [Nostocoides sp.]